MQNGVVSQVCQDLQKSKWHVANLTHQIPHGEYVVITQIRSHQATGFGCSLLMVLLRQSFVSLFARHCPKMNIAQVGYKYAAFIHLYTFIHCIYIFRPVPTCAHLLWNWILSRKTSSTHPSAQPPPFPCPACWRVPCGRRYGDATWGSEWVSCIWLWLRKMAHQGITNFCSYSLYQ